MGTLASINPMNGVYDYMVGGLSGAFFTNSVSLSIQATSAMAVIVATVPEVGLGQPAAKDALLVFSLLTGLFMVVLACCVWVVPYGSLPIRCRRPSRTLLAFQ